MNWPTLETLLVIGVLIAVMSMLIWNWDSERKRAARAEASLKSAGLPIPVKPKA